jgi:hypothetical protein
MRTSASFRLFGDADRPAAAVTERLGIVPSSSFEVGEPMGRGSSTARVHSGWLLSTGDVVDGVELGTQLDALLTQLEPRTQELWRLEEAGYTANWFCYVGSDPTEHAVELDRRLLARLLALPGELWLDVSV